MDTNTELNILARHLVNQMPMDVINIPVYNQPTLLLDIQRRHLCLDLYPVGLDCQAVLWDL